MQTFNTITKAPEISVIVPVYNSGKYLRECIDSILAQTFSDFELILIDDGSTDDSPAICDEYAARDHRIHVIHQPNSGVSAARNAGIEAAKGQWIMFVDSDDMIKPDMVQTLLDEAERTDADIVTCDFEFLYPDGHKEPYATFNWNEAYVNALTDYITELWTICCGCLIRRQLFTMHVISYPIGIRWCEDFHVIVRLIFYSKKIHRIEKCLYLYRQNEDSLCHNMPSSIAADALWVYEDIISFFKRNGAYSTYAKVMAWRSLWHAQELALNTATFDQFLLHNPDKKHFILDCPFLNRKMKIITWCLTHHLRPISTLIVKTRKLLGR